MFHHTPLTNEINQALAAKAADLTRFVDAQLNRQRDENGFMIRRTEGLTIVTRGVTWTDADVRGIDESGISLCVLGGLLKLVEWPAIETVLVEELGE